MKLSTTIRRLSYSAPLRKVIRILGLHGFASACYLRTFVDTEKQCTFEAAGYKGVFSARTPSEFRVLESITYRESALPSLLKLVQPGDVVLDVGAHRGLYTVLLARAAGPQGKVISVEPDERSYDRLRSNLHMNTLDTRVSTFKLALGNETGSVDLCLMDEAMAAVVHDKNRQVQGIVQRVSVIPGDDLIKANGLPYPNIIKIDVEGFEYAVLQGLAETLSQGNCRIVCCEVHPDKLPEGITAEMISVLLRNHGFVSLKILPCPPEYHLFAARTAQDLARTS